MHLTPLQELLCTPGELHVDEGALHVDEGALHVDEGALHVDEGALHVDEGAYAPYEVRATHAEATHAHAEAVGGALHADRMPTTGSGKGAYAPYEVRATHADEGATHAHAEAVGGATHTTDLPYDADIDKLLASPTSSEINTFTLLSTPDIQSAWDAGIEFPPTPGRDTRPCESVSVPPPCVWVTPPQSPTSMSSEPRTPHAEASEPRTPHAEASEPQKTLDPPQQTLMVEPPMPMTPPRTLHRPLSFSDDPFLEVDMELFPELENSSTPEPEPTTPATSGLFSKFGSGPYVVSRIVHRLGRPNIPKLQEEFKVSLKTVYKKAKKNDEEVTKKSFGNSSVESYSHSVLKQVLKINGKKAVKVSDSTQFLEKNCLDYIVYCSLNIDHFHFKGLSFNNMIMDENDGASHILLIQDGFLYCKYLKKSDNRNRRLLAKTVISFDEDGKLTNNSYIKEIYGVFRIV